MAPIHLGPCPDAGPGARDLEPGPIELNPRLPVFATLNIDPATRVRTCQDIDHGHVHGDVPCTQAATIHCRRSGEDVCTRHESGHAARTGCGQGDHEALPCTSAGA